ncbi:hypothetical protein K443DRAFT_128904 [Laccaria amethystina LaAM-08-1]|uniref:Mug135-like C-terminal domain-containing protein n=1 Tax=Laccaria amethystina LaAM-08-1 TaxID=1095629 RepID=A0A0C9XS19_9AGAR|nr:hypothetical protein K443DRAFT_128904 [Laccaria amethystina LaAM-08-1]
MEFLFSSRQTGLLQQIRRSQQQIYRLQANFARRRNAASGDGSASPFITVCFINGDDPTAKGLPPLQSVADVDNLSEADAMAYLTGYGFKDVPDDAVTRRGLIKIAIGSFEVLER